MKSVEEQLSLIRRGAEQVVPEDELRKKLERSVKTGKPLRVKYGIDPTGFDVHLGHTVPLRKLRLFQDLGHQAVLILGDYTAMVGDPSGRDDSRKGLTPEQIEANAQGYLTQIAKVVDVSRAEVRRNGEWFGKFNFADVLALTGQITMQRMLERDDFTKRVKQGTPIYVSECLYPLMQGRDSVEIKADVELGGSEQLYNLMVGRDLQTDAKQEPQICLTMPILRGLDGQKKMGKSVGNYIGVAESAYDMFAKTMKIADHLIAEWFELLTDLSAEQIAELTDAQKTPPMEAKKVLGETIAAFYHGPEAARAAREEWIRRIPGKGDPSEVPEGDVPASEVTDGKIGICRLLTLVGMVKSNNEGRRAVEGGGVNVGPAKTKITDVKANIEVHDGLIVRWGARRVVRVRLR